ncbi:MAG: DUF4147 domain-containing protein [Pirellulaceae bacterium]
MPSIWQAGVQVRRGDMVMRQMSKAGPGGRWRCVDRRGQTRSILVVGGGKACASMVTGLEVALENSPAANESTVGLTFPMKPCDPLAGFIFTRLDLPHGNLPTEAARQGCRGDHTVGRQGCHLPVVVLISGEAPPCCLPIPERSLDKVELTQLLSAGGADIVELNAIHQSLTDQGGRFAAGRSWSQAPILVISDVAQRSVESIASGTNR